MAYQYSNVEYTEMVRMLAMCDDNVLEAWPQYAVRFPNLPASSPVTMLAATQQLRLYEITGNSGMLSGIVVIHAEGKHPYHIHRAQELTAISTNKYFNQNGVYLKPDMICVGLSREEDRVTPCLAVPGAPLVVDGNLAAIQSWGYGCGYEHDLPLIYTNIQHYQPWLLHNVPLLRRIDKDKLTILFEAKRAYILSKWLNLTRVIRPEPFTQSYKPMVMMKLDRELAKLRGHVLDIRDVLFNGLHHQYKQKLYTKLRQRESYKNFLEKERESIGMPRLVPFLNANETDLEGADENLLKDGTNSDSDKSYEEY